MAAGYVASAVMIPLVDAGVLPLSAVALVAVLCLVIIAFLVLPESVISSIPLIKGAGRRTEKPADDQEEHPEPQLTLEPVSYTHLDVYKRQEHSRPGGRVRELQELAPTPMMVPHLRLQDALRRRASRIAAQASRPQLVAPHLVVP